MSDQSTAMPVASFDFLVWSLRMQAEAHLGIMSIGEEKPQVSLPLARHFIDLLAMLQEKTRNNLSLEEQRLLENSLTELRFRYIQAHEQEKNKAAQAGGTAAPSAAEENAASHGAAEAQDLKGDA